MQQVVYLINLDGSEDRLARARAQLAAAGVAFTRVPAFDGRALKIEDFPDYDPKLTYAHLGRAMTGGEIGCYLSHLDCARRFLQSDADVAVVLEDDFEMQPGMVPVLQQMLAWLEQNPFDWYLINLGAKRLKTRTEIARFAAGGREHGLYRAHAFPTLTTGLVWSRPGAEAFLRNHDKIFAAVDNYFRHWLIAEDKGLAIWPAIVQAGGFASLINKVGAHRKKSQRSRFYFFYKQRNQWRDKLLALSHKYFGPPKG